MSQLRSGRLLGGLNSNARVLATADFRAPLRTSLVPTRGTGAPSFTRATTGTVVDHEGVIRTCLAGEARFTGARRVQNLWGIQSATLAVAASNTMTLPAGSYIFSMGAGTGTATFSGTGGATGTLAAGGSRVSVLKSISAGTLIVTGSVATLTDLQVEDVTAQTIQTAGEYVSMGVLSFPYHGTGVDGVKCFDTTLAGVPIPAATLKGYLAEGQRTNHFKVSAAPATQTSASLSTGTYTLWMDGTGSITIAGATATITGAGTANSGTAITFTVTVAGTVTYTVTGSPTRAQSEDGPTRTSYIDVPSTTAVTRNADVLTYPNSGNILGTVGTCYAELTIPNGGDSTRPPRIITVSSSSERNVMYASGIYGGKGVLSAYDGTAIAPTGDGSIDLAGALNKVASAWGGSTTKAAIGGLLNSGNFDGDFNVNEIRIGALFVAGYEINGNIADVCIWTRKLPDAILKRISK